MPWFRKKLMPGSKVLLAQKRWFRWYPFPWYHVRNYMDLMTPINKLKEKSVALEKELMLCRTHIEILQKEYDAMVKHMGTKTSLRDSDRGPVTQWKYEKQPHFWLFSLFQWAIPFIEEPPAFDPKLYNFRGRGGGPDMQKRDKEVDLGINSLHKDAADFAREMEAQEEEREKGDGTEDTRTTRLATFTAGDGDKGMQRKKGEELAHFNKRKEESRGKIEGINYPPDK